MGQTAPDRSTPESFEQERHAILQAARELLAANGYSGLKVPVVGARAGVSMRRFYKHFDSKLHLLRALYDREREGIRRRIDRALMGVTDPVEKLDVWVYEMIRAPVEPELRSRALRFAIVRVEVLAEFGVELWDTSELAPSALIEVVREGVEAGVFGVADPLAASRAIYALSVGTMYNVFALSVDQAKEALEIAQQAARRIANIDG